MPQIGRKAQGPGQAQAKKKRQQGGQAGLFLQNAAKVFHQGEGFLRAVIVDAQSLHKAQAVGGQSHALPVAAQPLRAGQQHGLFQIEKISSARSLDPALQGVQHVQTAAETPSAAAAAKGEQGQQAALAAEQLQPEIRFAEMPDAQNHGLIGPFHHCRAAGGKVSVRTWPDWPGAGMSCPL